MNTATKLFTIALLGVTLDVSGAPVGALQANAEFDQSKEKLTAAEQKITELVAKREMYKKEKVSASDKEELLASINKSPTANSAELVQGEWNINWKHYAYYYEKRASACEAVPKITCGKGTKQGPLTRDTSVNNVNAKKGQCVPLPEDALAKRRPLYAIGMLPAAH